MRILKMQVNNYKSLKSVEVEFGNQTILIGKNSSGKTNFLEALHLFFHEFPSTGTKNVGGTPDYLWHSRETRNPIRLIITFKLSKREYDQIFTSDLESIRPKFKHGTVVVGREIGFIPPSKASLRTNFVSFEDKSLIDDGELILVEIPETTGAFAQKMAMETTLFSNISKMLTDKFRFIFSVRNTLSSIPDLTERSLNIPSEIHSDMVTTLESDSLADSRMWEQIERDTGEIPTLRRLSVRGGQLRNREGIIRFPLPYLGGGDQEILALIFLLRKEKRHIFAIEEPETHFHPSLARRFFNILKDVSKNKQIILTTHSPVFMDLANLSNAWIFRKNENRETEAHRIQGEEDLRAVSYELGIKPSDVFFADRILFVEGPIDKTVYGIWADKLRLDLRSPIISVIPLLGKSKGKRHLQAWMEVTRNIPVSVSMILDKDAKDEANKLIKDKMITRKQISVLSKGAIEDYYDAKIMTSVMKKTYGEKFTENDLKPSQSEGLTKFLKRQHKDWRARSRAKFKIGEETANRMSKDQIHGDVSSALEKTREYLELPYS